MNFCLIFLPKDFMVCCNCVTGCQPATCACMRLTQEGYEASEDFHKLIKPLKQKLADGELSPEVFQVQKSQLLYNCGYKQGLIRRDKESDQQIFSRSFSNFKSVTTSGVYECHSGCACKDGWCNNRVGK